MTFIEQVKKQREQVAERLIAMIDSYRLMERYTTVFERNRLVANINAMITRYDRLTSIQRRLEVR